MARVYVSIGSNLEPRTHVPAALAALRRRYGELTLSQAYESLPVGLDGANFINMVVGFDTGEDVEALVGGLRAIERQQGRARGESRYAPRTLDLDLLLYDDRVIVHGAVRLPREDILAHAFVLRPLAEIAPERRHPLLGRSYAQLWKELGARPDGQALWPVALPGGRAADRRGAAID